MGKDCAAALIHIKVFCCGTSTLWITAFEIQRRLLVLSPRVQFAGHRRRLREVLEGLLLLG